MKMLSDKYIVYPLVKQSDWVYTNCNIKPNTITLFNNVVITPIMLYYLYYDYFMISVALVWFRAYLDGLDGYIARKFKECSELGNIYDHFSDSLYTGFLTNILMSKIHMLQPYAAPIGYVNAMFAIVCDFDDNFDWVAKIAGVGGNEEGYSFLIPFGFVAFTWSLSLLGLIG